MGADATEFRIKNCGLDVRAALHPAGSPGRLGRRGDRRLVAEKLFQGADPVGKNVAIERPALPGRSAWWRSRAPCSASRMDKFAVVPFDAPVRRGSAARNTIDELHVKADGCGRDADRAGRGRRRSCGCGARLKPAAGEQLRAPDRGRRAGGLAARSPRILFAALPGLVAISLVVGGIVIMNIMLMAVAERTRRSASARRWAPSGATSWRSSWWSRRPCPPSARRSASRLGIGLAFAIAGADPAARRGRALVGRAGRGRWASASA